MWTERELQIIRNWVRWNIPGRYEVLNSGWILESSRERGTRFSDSYVHREGFIRALNLLRSKEGTEPTRNSYRRILWNAMLVDLSNCSQETPNAFRRVIVADWYSKRFEALLDLFKCESNNWYDRRLDIPLHVDPMLDLIEKPWLIV